MRGSMRAQSGACVNWKICSGNIVTDGLATLHMVPPHHEPNANLSGMIKVLRKIMLQYNVTDYNSMIPDDEYDDVDEHAQRHTFMRHAYVYASYANNAPVIEHIRRLISMLGLYGTATSMELRYEQARSVVDIPYVIHKGMNNI